MILNVYVPKPNSSAARLILPASVIVGEGEKEERILCYYEGNAIGSKDLESFYERLRSRRAPRDPVPYFGHGCIPGRGARSCRHL
jgi:hypothetical protein